MLHFHKLLTLLVFLMSPAFASNIIFSSFEWCPYSCPTLEEKGYLIDLAKEIYQNDEQMVDINISTWKLAIKQVESGRSAGLLAPARNEAPSLVFPNEPIGRQRFCFYTSAVTNWYYEGDKPLENNVIIAPVAASLPQLDPNPNNPILIKPIHGDFKEKALKMISNGRYQAGLFEENTVEHYLNLTNQKSQFKQAGCLPGEFIYIGFSPSNKTLSENYAKQFDEQIQILRNNGQLAEILGKYGLNDWSDN